jgi:hypothetical protein
MIKMYNNHKGGTDQFDQSLLKYGIRIRSKKWYWSIFAWVLNASLVTSWRFYRDMKNSNLSLLSYSREVVTALLLQFGAPSKKAGKTNRFIATDLLDNMLLQLFRTSKSISLVDKPNKPI